MEQNLGFPFNNSGNINDIIKMVQASKDALKKSSTFPWEQLFTSHLEELFSKKADKATTMECSSCTLAAQIARAMYNTIIPPFHPTFFRNLYECVECLLLHPFTCTLQRDGTGYTVINIRMKDYHVVKAEPKLGDRITEEHNHFSRFREEIREILKRYLENSLLLRGLIPNRASLEETLDACIRKYAVNK